MRDRFRTWLRNSRTAHQRALVRYLRRRGWIVFWLDDEARTCRAVCWLREYLRSEMQELIESDVEAK